MNEPFPNAPDLGQDFDKIRKRDVPEIGRELDAEDSEPLHDVEELNFDPPQRVYGREQVLEPTPFGTIDAEVQRELDPAAQQAIRDAQQQREMEDGFADLRSIDEVPGAGAEYEAHLREQDDYETRMRDRFNHAKERSLERDR